MNRRLATSLTVLAGICALAGAVAAQTPSGVCALDSLRLISPGEITVRYEACVDTVTENCRPGVLIRWPEVDDAVSTCTAVIDTAGIGVDIAVDGIYADVVDRELSMISNFGGEIGAPDVDRVLVNWANSNQALSGRLSGVFNLSNNGGVLSYEDGAWTQVNDGLLPYLPRTDVLHLREAPGGGGMIAHLSGQLARGLWRKADADSPWMRVAPELFRDGTISTNGITALAYSPDDPEVFAVGTAVNGLYITRNGGETFDQYKAEFSTTGNWNLRAVAALSWESATNLLVAIDRLGVYRSQDGGASYALLSTFLVSENFPTGGTSIAPSVNTILDLGGGNLLVGVDRFGIYQSLDNGLSWDWRWNGLLNPSSEPKDVVSILVSPLDANRITIGTRTSGMWWTPNLGGSWIQLSGDFEWPEGDRRPAISQLIVDEAAGIYLGAADGFALLECAVGDTAWSLSSIDQPGNRNIQSIQLSEQDGVSYRLGTYGGGIYVPGSQLRLSDTILGSSTDTDLQNLDLGVYMSFASGAFEPGGAFSLVLQDFQGYAVWRADVDTPDEMELIGLYDKSNPESCIDGYCGDASYNQLPDCFADKRAACFNFSNPDYVEFFDGNVYEGFTYYYAVTTFDYGNIANVSPNSMAAEQLFSPRYVGDQLALHTGAGNRTQLYVIRGATDPLKGPEIFAYPNPLRLDSGFAGAEGVDVRFKNLPPDSRVLVFTLDGDQVADLSGPDQSGDVMTWSTLNGTERLASGVYIYKVEMPEREAFYGKVVVIR